MRALHPAAELLPPMTAAEFRELVDDIRDHGLQMPVVVHPEAFDHSMSVNKGRG